MADRPDAQPDDCEVALKNMEHDPDGLRLLIRGYGPRVKGYLKKRFGDVLDSAELEEAFCTTLQKVWRHAARFDDRKGTLASWLIRIARNCAVTILNREGKRSEHECEFDPEFDPAADMWGPADEWGADAYDEKGDAKKDARLWKDLDEIIRKLPPLQQAIVRADLASPHGRADSQRLAEKLDSSSKNSIEVSRNRARAVIQTELIKRGHFQDQQRAKK